MWNTSQTLSDLPARGDTETDGSWRSRISSPGLTHVFCTSFTQWTLDTSPQVSLSSSSDLAYGCSALVFFWIFFLLSIHSATDQEENFSFLAQQFLIKRLFVNFVSDVSLEYSCKIDSNESAVRFPFILQ